MNAMLTLKKIIRAKFPVALTCAAGLSFPVSALGQLTPPPWQTPLPPPAPTHTRQCAAYAARMNDILGQLTQEIKRVGEEDASQCSAAMKVSIATGEQVCDSPSRQTPLMAQWDRVENDLRTNLEACYRQVQAYQSQHAEQGNGTGIFQVSAVSYAQEAGGALPDLLAHAKSPMVAGVAEWASKAFQAKQYFDTAQSLLKLSSPNITQQDRLGLMQSLELTAAQSMPNVNPISSIMMAVGVNIIKGIYLKNMQALQTEMAAFATGVPQADPEELDMQSLYAEATPPGYRDAADALKQLQTSFSGSANTYIGSAVSWSARSQQSAPAVSSSGTASSETQSGSDCESVEAPIVQECMQPYYGPPCNGAHISVSCFERALQAGAGICSDSVMAGYRQSLEQARQAVAYACQ